jgi:hypothetical protein
VSEVSEVSVGRGVALVVDVSRLLVGGILPGDCGGGSGDDPVGWLLAPELTLANEF